MQIQEPRSNGPTSPAYLKFEIQIHNFQIVESSQIRLTNTPLTQY